jgi:hypothetical protein
MRLRVLRAFYLGGTRQEPGKAIDAPDQLARELIATGKAESASGEPPPRVSGPMTTESVQPLVPGKAARKGAKDAG